MKTRFIASKRRAGYALLMVLVLSVASILILAGTLGRSYSVANNNERYNQYLLCQNVAEAAAEKVFARIAYDFSSSGQGLAAVQQNLANGSYVKDIPGNDRAEGAFSGYWNNFEFSNGQNVGGRVYVAKLTDYTGPLPSQFAPLATRNAPVYRIVVNTRMKDSRYNITGAIQEDVLLGLVPISNTAIFDNTLLEFTWCAPFTINGHVHSNGSIYTGTSSGSYLKFNGPVTTVGTVTSPAWAGHSTSEYKGAITYNAGKTTNSPAVQLSLNMTNTHSLIEMPSNGEDPNSDQGQARLYNQAQVVLLVSNTSVTAVIQNGTLPGADSSKQVISVTNSPNVVATNFPFLTLTNTFKDQRENKTILATQIDLGKYNTWLSTNSAIATKFSASSGNYPTILYVADNRTTSSSQLTAVRLTNGIAPPSNGGLGFSLATPNPLYVWGNYNQTRSSYLNTTNTSAGTVPSALMSDALTILSSNWRDSQSSQSFTSRDASDTTINAAILAGMVYSTGSKDGQFSGGIMNMPRLLEDWGNGGSTTLTLNTSLISLYASTRATAQFQDPGNYYYAPTRQFSFDLNFLDPSKQPPGMPCALIPVRFNFTTPPPNTVTYNVTP
jgi:hypothetical protein